MKQVSSDDSSSSSSSSSDSEASSSDDEKGTTVSPVDVDPMLTQPAPPPIDNTWKIENFVKNYSNVSNTRESPASTSNSKKKPDQAETHSSSYSQPLRRAKTKPAVYTPTASDDSSDEDFEPDGSHSSPANKRQLVNKQKKKKQTTKKSPTKLKTKTYKSSSIIVTSDSDSSGEDDALHASSTLDEKSEETKPNIQPYYSNLHKRKPMAVITPLNSTTPSNPNSITEISANNPNISAAVALVGASQTHGRQSIVVSLSLELLRSVGAPIPRINNSIPATPSRERKRKKSPNETKDRGEKRIKKFVLTNRIAKRFLKIIIYIRFSFAFVPK